MKAKIYGSIKAEAILTTDHSTSSYGKPVLLVGEDAYGPADVLPSGLTAADLVKGFLKRKESGGGIWGDRTEEAVTLAERFLR